MEQVERRKWDNQAALLAARQASLPLVWIRQGAAVIDAMTSKEIQDVSMFRVAYFDGRRVGMQGLSSEVNPFPDQQDELRAAWGAGHFSGLKRAIEHTKILRRRNEIPLQVGAY